MTRIIDFWPDCHNDERKRPDNNVPSMNRSGNRIRKTGFQSSRLVRVTVKDNRLVVTSIES